MRIAAWSGPRNLSTALMYSFARREDCAVVDEPFYAAYLARTGLAHPLRAEVLASQPTDPRTVLRSLTEEPVPRGRALFYQKHMTQHILPHMRMDWTAGLANCFLIREPRRIIASYAKVRPRFAVEELGFPQQWELFQRVADRLGEAPPVIDSARTLENPERVLRALCGRLGIGFTARMLHWPAGRRDSDGVWAPHWYAAVERSTGFQPVNEVPLEEVPVPAGCQAMCERAEGIYARLLEHAL